METKFKTAISLFISLFILSGCLGVDKEFRNRRTELLSFVDCKYEKNIEFSVGQNISSYAGALAQVKAKEVDVEDMLRNVKKVQVGIYENKTRNWKAKKSQLDKIINFMKEEKWIPIITRKADSEINLFFVEQDGDKLERLFAISFSSDEIIFAEFEGNIEKILAVVISEKGLNFAKN